MNVKKWNEIVLAKLMTVQPEVNPFNPYQILCHLARHLAVPFNISAANPWKKNCNLMTFVLIQSLGINEIGPTVYS